MKLLSFLILFLMLSYLSKGFSQYNLLVKVHGIQNTNGQIELSIYNDANVFPEVGKTYKMVRIDSKESEIIYEFKDLPAGEYAIATYHDENNDNECNTNLLGVPTEAFAFSNDFRPFLSAPDFSDCSFKVTQNMELTIEMVY
ncbi:MAG: hypothetical protein RLZ10_392 [Bacteroidota bacterium]|jgi:uncharacterized protein (DUF2141 family)